MHMLWACYLLLMLQGGAPMVVEEDLASHPALVLLIGLERE